MTIRRQKYGQRRIKFSEKGGNELFFCSHFNQTFGNLQMLQRQIVTDVSARIFEAILPRLD